MGQHARIVPLLLLALAAAVGAHGQAKLGEIERANPRPTLQQAIQSHGAKHDPLLALTPPEQADQASYWLSGVLMDRIGALYLVKMGFGYWAYRTTEATREHLVGLRPGDTVAVVGKLEAVRPLRRSDGKTAPTVILVADYVTNDEAQIPDDFR